MKQKEVVNICDGKRLGKVCDVVFSYPEGKVQGLVAPGGRGFRWGKGDLFIDLKNVTKIGVDTVLVEIRSAPAKQDKRSKWGSMPPPPPPAPEPYYRGDRRDYGEYE